MPLRLHLSSQCEQIAQHRSMPVEEIRQSVAVIVAGAVDGTQVHGYIWFQSPIILLLVIFTPHENFCMMHMQLDEP
jgi:hypothetical protein